MDRRAIVLAGLLVAFIVGRSAFLTADELPENEFQAAFNGYFDNFRVNVLYPTVSLTKRIAGSTSFTGRYLVDAITAASMRSRFAVDGVTSATTRWGKDGVPAAGLDGVTGASSRSGESERPETTFDEVRHEYNASLVQLIGEGTLTVNALYSTEHDYRSITAAGQVSYPFAMKNTTVQVGLVRSWDRVAPDTRDWTRKKNVVTGSAGLTQAVSERAIVQANASVTRMTGFLSDPYQPVPVFAEGTFTYRETVLPSSRIRYAVGLRGNWMWADRSSLQIGYRRYWDDWRIRSNTWHATIQRTFGEKDGILGFTYRRYDQTRADFFSTVYFHGDGLLTVDTKLNACWSNEWEINAVIQGTYLKDRAGWSAFYSEKVEYRASLALYQRRSATPDWFSGYRDLYAYIVSIGLRYRF